MKSFLRKVVLSKTLNEKELENTKVISNRLVENINSIKSQEGKNIVIFGCPTASHALMSHSLVDEYWLFVNPILLGNGIPLFKPVTETLKLKRLESNIVSGGVVALHYETNTAQ